MSTKSTTHRPFFLTAILLSAGLFFTTCTKDNEPICWLCDMTTLPPGSVNLPDIVEICNDSNQPPTEYSDGQGNTVGGFECTKK